MSTIYRNRTIRPSSRLETSVSYKINTEKVTTNDTLVITINHESENFSKEFTFFQERRLQTVPQYTSDILMEKLFGHQFSLIRFISFARLKLFIIIISIKDTCNHIDDIFFNILGRTSYSISYILFSPG